MTQMQLQSFAEARGLVVMGPTVVGTWNGYPFMATLRFGRINVLNTTFSYLKGPSAKQLRQARKSMPRGCALSWTEGKTVLVCSGRDEQLFELFQAGMDAVTELLRACNTSLSGSCALCKQGGCDSFALAGGGYVPVHESCCENASHDKVSRAALNSLQGSYAAGWAGAILGSLVGAIPTILLAVFVEMISGWLCALIPLAAYYGYKLFKGKMDKMATVAAIVSSLLQAFVVEQVIFYCTVVDVLGLWLSPFDSIGYYFEVMDVSDMLVDMIQPLIFIALGIFIVFGIIKRTSQNDVLDAGAMLDSITDLNGVRRARPVQQQAAQPGWGQPNQWGQPAQAAAQPGQWGQPPQAAPQPGQWGQPPQAAAQSGQWGQPPQAAAQPSQWGQPTAQTTAQSNQWSQPAQAQWEPATAARPLVANPARTSTRPIQPAQPAQPTSQPVQPPQWGQPAQWGQPTGPVQPAQQWTAAPPAEPVQPASPWAQPVSAQQPAAGTAPAALDETPGIQTPPVIQPVAPLNAEMPVLPDLPEVPDVSSLEEK